MENFVKSGVVAIIVGLMLAMYHFVTKGEAPSWTYWMLYFSLFTQIRHDFDQPKKGA